MVFLAVKLRLLTCSEYFLEPVCCQGCHFGQLQSCPVRHPHQTQSNWKGPELCCTYPDTHRVVMGPWDCTWKYYRCFRSRVSAHVRCKYPTIPSFFSTSYCNNSQGGENMLGKSISKPFVLNGTQAFLNHIDAWALFCEFFVVIDLFY